MLPVKRSSRASHGCQRKAKAARDRGVAVDSLGMTWLWKAVKVSVGLFSRFSGMFERASRWRLKRMLRNAAACREGVRRGV